jgi:NADPH:quinone reductase-like Zn-dependent oxidoreductase
MKAIAHDAYGTSAVLHLDELDRPAPGEGEVLVEVAASSIHVGDWHLMTGLPLLARLALGLSAPRDRVLGMDVAGRIAAVGPGVSAHALDDAVFGVAKGAWAQFAVASADAVVRAPSNLSPGQAAAIPTSGATALHAVRDAGSVRAGQRVLVIGAAGGVGIFAVQIAKALGAHVTGVCSGPKLDLVLSLGADAAIDYRRDDFTIAPERYDLIIDTGGRRPVSLTRRALTPDGTLVIVGGEGGGRILGGFERSLLAPLAGVFSQQTIRGLISLTRAADLDDLRALAEAGALSPVIDSTWSLAETPAAMHRLENGRAIGKLIIEV